MCQEKKQKKTLLFYNKKGNLLNMRNQLNSKNLLKLNKYLPILQFNKFNKNFISLTVHKSKIISSLNFLKNNASFQFKILSCISGVDYPNKKTRFKIVYELLSLRFNSRIRVCTHCDELSSLDSSAEVFKAASWYESEIWDMFGVFFAKHPNLNRILTDYGFEGYPLRKDFPLSGFVESGYDYTKKQVLNTRLELSQEFKPFEFESPWKI